jgi:hypothetical protein
VAPEEVAALAVYLASDAAAYVTGNTFIVDGGMMRRAGSLQETTWSRLHPGAGCKGRRLKV